jgi:hypothetical protein
MTVTEATPDLTIANAAPGVRISWPYDQGLDTKSWQVLVADEHVVHQVRPVVSKVVPQKQTVLLPSVDPTAPHTFTVQYVDSSGVVHDLTSKRQEGTPGRLRWTWVLTSLAVVVLLAAAGISCAVVAGFRHRDYVRAGSAAKNAHTLHRQYEILWSLAIAFLVVTVAALLLTAVHARKDGKPYYGLWRMIIGSDNRVSTSAVTATMWTFLVAFMLAYFIPRTWLFQHEPHLFDGLTPGRTSDDQSVWPDYLLLLGGPFASLVLARGITSAKVTNGTLQKTVADDGTQSIKQALTDDSGNVDLVDSQYVIFNLVAFAYVIFGVAGTNRLPTIPGLLLALTGSSAATYVVSKGLQSSVPTISSVLPSRLRPGDRFTIAGSNLRPGGETGQVPQVSVGGVPALVDAASTDTSVVATLGLGTPVGVQSIAIVSSANVTGNSNVEVLSDNPVVLSAGSLTVRGGRTLRVVGGGFTDAFATDHHVTVQVTTEDGTQHVFSAVPTPLTGPTQTVEGTLPEGVKGKVTVAVISSRGILSPDLHVTLT